VSLGESNVLQRSVIKVALKDSKVNASNYLFHNFDSNHLKIFSVILEPYDFTHLKIKIKNAKLCKTHNLEKRIQMHNSK